MTTRKEGQTQECVDRITDRILNTLEDLKGPDPFSAAEAIARDVVNLDILALLRAASGDPLGRRFQYDRDPRTRRVRRTVIPATAVPSEPEGIRGAHPVIDSYLDEVEREDRSLAERIRDLERAIGRATELLAHLDTCPPDRVALRCASCADSVALAREALVLATTAQGQELEAPASEPSQAVQRLEAVVTAAQAILSEIGRLQQPPADGDPPRTIQVAQHAVRLRDEVRAVIAVLSALPSAEDLMRQLEAEVAYQALHRDAFEAFRAEADRLLAENRRLRAQLSAAVPGERLDPNGAAAEPIGPSLDPASGRCRLDPGAAEYSARNNGRPVKRAEGECPSV